MKLLLLNYVALFVHFCPAARMYICGWIHTKDTYAHIYDTGKMKVGLGLEKWNEFKARLLEQFPLWVCVHNVMHFFNARPRHLTFENK